MSTDKPRGLKYDEGKPRMDLVTRGFPKVLTTLGTILGFGAKKYRADSWRQVPNGVSRYEAAAMRHFIAHSSGEKLDPESGLPHLAHAICNLMFVMELIEAGEEYEPE